jgi:hypothetical protein
MRSHKIDWLAAFVIISMMIMASLVVIDTAYNQPPSKVVKTETRDAKYPPIPRRDDD